MTEFEKAFYKVILKSLDPEDLQGLVKRFQGDSYLEKHEDEMIVLIEEVLNNDQV